MTRAEREIHLSQNTPKRR